MATEADSNAPLEIGRVLFIDIVGYWKGLINEQSNSLQKLKEVVRGKEQFRLAEAVPGRRNGSTACLIDNTGRCITFVSCE